MVFGEIPPYTIAFVEIGTFEQKRIPEYSPLLLVAAELAQDAFALLEIGEVFVDRGVVQADV
jgi:hypothetical protein